MTETPSKLVNVTQVVPEDHSVEVKVEVEDAEGVVEEAEEGEVKQEANYGNKTRIRVTEILQNPEEEVKVEVGFRFQLNFNLAVTKTITSTNTHRSNIERDTDK